jgi:hypothetical protein
VTCAFWHLRGARRPSPVEDLVGVLMTQFMVGIDLPEQDLRALTYQAIID